MKYESGMRITGKRNGKESAEQRSNNKTGQTNYKNSVGKHWAAVPSLTAAQSIQLSRLPIAAWTAKKEYTENYRPYLHLNVELQRSNLVSSAISIRILQDQLGIYFRYLDQDYEDLKRILGIDPLKITMLKCGTFEMYEEKYGNKIRTMNPESCEINDLLNCHRHDNIGRGAILNEWI